MMKGQLRKYGLIAGLIAMGIFGLPLIASDQAEAALGQVRVYPNSDISHNNWGAESGRGNRWSNVNRLTNDPRPSENNWICSTANTASVRFGVGGGSNGVAAPLPSVQQGVTRIVQAQTVGKAGYERFELLQPRMQLSVSVGGSTVATSNSETWIGAPGVLTEPQCGTNGGPWSDWHAATIANYVVASGQEWTQQQLETMELVLNRQAPPVGSTARAVRVMALNALLEYVTYSTLTQNGYQFYKHNPSATSASPNPTQALSSQMPTTPSELNIATEKIEVGGNELHPFRLRMAIETTAERWLRQYGEYNLQYAEKTGSSCTPSASWQDVIANFGAIRWYDNPNINENATITGASWQPGASEVRAQYYRESNPFNKREEVAINNAALWDFSLQYVGSSNGDSYCFRIVNNGSGTQPLNAYTNYPELTINSLDGAFEVEVLDGADQPIAAPYVQFPQLYASMLCQPNSAQFSTSAQRLRVTDNRPSGNWTLNVAPTDGQSARWEPHPANPLVTGYAVNGAGQVTDTNCADGRLDLVFPNPTGTPKSGCTNTGVTYGNGRASFGNAASITIANANGAERGCYWDMPQINLEQRVPGQTPADAYRLPLTVTLMSS